MKRFTPDHDKMVAGKGMTIFSRILLLVMVFMFTSFSVGIEHNAKAYEDEVYSCGDFDYIVLSDGTAEIVGYSSYYDEILVIPDSLDGFKVTRIGDDAFDYCSCLISVTIPESVASMGINPFTCFSLVNIEVSPENEYYATIDGVLFEKSTKTLVCYPAGSTADRYSVPEGILRIGDEAFYGCEIGSIYIPDSVANIGNDSFVFSYGIAYIEVSPDNEYFASIDGVLFEKSTKTLVYYPTGLSADSYCIPEGIQIIGDKAFADCALNSVSIPNTVTRISDMAFCGCTSLTSIIIPDSVTYIGDNAFYNCNSLTNITIPDSVTHIGDGAFCLCIELRNITIPDSVMSIGDGAFARCYSLNSITIPDSVTSIGTNPFIACYSLVKIDVSPDSAYFASIDGVLFEKSTKKLICYPAGLTADSYSIPEGILGIGAVAFSECELLCSINIPDSVTYIDEWAFTHCYSLSNITIPDSVTYIGDYAFANCTSISSITIPDSVTEIGECAFQCCSSISSITISDSVTYIGDYAFLGCGSLELIVDRGSYAAEYAKLNDIPYTYPDANDWLGN